MSLFFSRTLPDDSSLYKRFAHFSVDSINSSSCINAKHDPVLGDLTSPEDIPHIYLPYWILLLSFLPTTRLQWSVQGTWLGSD